MSQEEIITKIKESIEQDANKDYIKSISLFGSFLYGNTRPDSDVDLLLEMKKTMSLFRIFAVQENLEKKLGHKVDLIEKNSIDKYIKDEIFTEAKKIYEN